MYLEDAQFESQPGLWLSWLRFLWLGGIAFFGFVTIQNCVIPSIKSFYCIHILSYIFLTHVFLCISSVLYLTGNFMSKIILKWLEFCPVGTHTFEISSFSVSHEQGSSRIEIVIGKGHRCFAQGGRTTADVTARTHTLFHASWKAYTPH